MYLLLYIRNFEKKEVVPLIFVCVHYISVYVTRFVIRFVQCLNQLGTYRVQTRRAQVHTCRKKTGLCLTFML